MDVGVVDVVFADWIVGNVIDLGGVVGFVADAVFVVARMPDFAFELLTDGEGEAALDELDRFGG